MSEVWNTLITLQNNLIKKFENSGTEIYEEGMEKFNKENWINKVWTGPKYRRAHIDIVDARDTKGLWMMHCCIFPHLHNDGPIFGLDVVAGKNKITGFFHDYSPTIAKDHLFISDFIDSSSKLEWRKKRELPDWAKAIFNEDMISAGNIQSAEELQQILDYSYESLINYLNYISDYNNTANPEEVKKAHNRYAFYQKQNPHTPRTMTALGLDESEVNEFIKVCLFPEI
jgi:hypothetical protein